MLGPKPGRKLGVKTHCSPQPTFPAVGLDPHDRRVLLAGDASARQGERPARVRVAHGVDVDPPDPAHVAHRGTIAVVDDQVILYTLNTEARTPT